MPEERLFSVTKPGIECCAINCPKNDSDKYFFSFPSCEASDNNSIERCRTWVNKSGNVDLLKCKSSELAGKFYLCCHHFADWTAINSSQRYIAADAVPTIFDCVSLGSTAMRFFPVTSESASEPNASENMNYRSPNDNTTNDNITTGQTKIGDSIPDVDPACFSTLDTLDTIKTETDDVEANNSCTSKNAEDLVSEDDVPLLVRDPSKLVEQSSAKRPVKKTPKKKRKIPTEENHLSTRPSRKAKQDAANRISKQFTPAKDSDRSEDTNVPESSHIESEEKTPSPSMSPNGINTNSADPLQHKIILPSKTTSPERTAAKYRIVSNDVVSKLGAVLQLRPSPLKSSESRNLDLGNKVTLLQDSGSKSKQDKLHVIVSPPPSQAAIKHRPNLLKESSGLRTILPKPRSGSRPNDTHPNFNLITVPRNEKLSRQSSVDNVMPILRTTSTQTESNSSDTERLVFKILDCDSKLSVFTGLPSYDVLDKITDATLGMVMSNKTTISDIEPTMRMWIMLTCTKFMLGISTEALSVMYDISEEECQKVIEKTSLFLRKTLSLPDCQKYVWMLPNEVLKGIADFSESMVC